MQISQFVPEKQVFLSIKISYPEITIKGKLTQQNSCIMTFTAHIHIKLVPNES